MSTINFNPDSDSVHPTIDLLALDDLAEDLTFSLPGKALIEFIPQYIAAKNTEAEAAVCQKFDKMYWWRHDAIRFEVTIAGYCLLRNRRTS